MKSTIKTNAKNHAKSIIAKALNPKLVAAAAVIAALAAEAASAMPRQHNETLVR